MPTPDRKRRIPKAPPKKAQAKKSDEEVYQDFLNNSGIKELAMKIRVMQAQREALGA